MDPKITTTSPLQLKSPLQQQFPAVTVELFLPAGLKDKQHIYTVGTDDKGSCNFAFYINLIIKGELFITANISRRNHVWLC